MTGISISSYRFSNAVHKKIAVVSDVHDTPYEKLISLLKEQRPDMICIPGDLSYRHVSNYPREGVRYKLPEYALDFLAEARLLAPVYVSRGNQEYRWDGYDIAELAGRGIRFLENNWAEDDGVLIGGVPSCYSPLDKKKIPDLSWLSDFERQEGYKILLCHHPEYYFRYLKGTKIDLVLSGHAHGGQIRIGNLGLFAPGQGLFPKFTSGIYDDRLVVSRGLSNKGIPVPRINNPFELVVVKI